MWLKLRGKRKYKNNFYCSIQTAERVKFKWIARWTGTWLYFLILLNETFTLVCEKRIFFIIIKSQMCIKMLSFSFVMKIAFSRIKKWHFMFASWHIFMTFCTSGRLFYEFNSLTCENFLLGINFSSSSLALLAQIPFRKFAVIHWLRNILREYFTSDIKFSCRRNFWMKNF
jgi:hypothetical protein